MIKRTAISIVLLNLVDLISTTVAIELGFAEELNPIMASAYAISPIVFAVAKILLVSFGVWVGWINRHMVVARETMSLIATFYTALIGWHAAMWFLFIRG